jgi:hypothetical protein
VTGADPAALSLAAPATKPSIGTGSIARSVQDWAINVRGAVLSPRGVGGAAADRVGYLVMEVRNGETGSAEKVSVMRPLALRGWVCMAA